MDKVRGMTALRRLEIFTLTMRIEPPTSRSADQRSNHQAKHVAINIVLNIKQKRCVIRDKPETVH